MPKITKPLTNTEVEKTKPRADEYNLADGGGALFTRETNGRENMDF